MLAFSKENMSQSDPFSNEGLKSNDLGVKRGCVRQVGLLSTALVDS